MWPSNNRRLKMGDSFLMKGLPPTKELVSDDGKDSCSESEEDPEINLFNFRFTSHTTSQLVCVSQAKSLHSRKRWWLLPIYLLGSCLLLVLTCAMITLVMDFRQQPASQSQISSQEGLQVQAKATKAVVGFDRMEVSDVWVTGFPKLMTESAFRMVDVNQDGILDVIFGFSTGLQGLEPLGISCDIYFNGSSPCHGGVMALEGESGRLLWRHNAWHGVFALNCNVDFNGDQVKDCLAGGKGEMLEMLSGQDGTLLWRHTPEGNRSVLNFYTSQPIEDVDGDSIPDVLAVHGGGDKKTFPGRILLLSGRDGRILRWVVVPDHAETYYSPQVVYHPAATPMVLFGTGGETLRGGLWSIPLKDLIKGRIHQATEVYHDDFKGVMTPPVLYDLTGDGVKDIIINPFNSSVLALDGLNYSAIWNYTVPWSESYSTPALGYYNEDLVPDVLVNTAIGPGFPLYYHSEVTVLDGRDGRPLLTSPIKSSLAVITSPLTVSVEGAGNDVFIYALSDCLGHEGEGGEYTFIKGTNDPSILRTDLCHQRYNTSTVYKFMAIGRHFRSPGLPVYSSDERKVIEHAHWVNTSDDVKRFLKEHPEYSKLAEKYQRCIGQINRGERCLVDLDSKEMEVLLGRRRRHLAPHDAGGVMNFISTGSLAPTTLPTSHPDFNQSIDLIFATYWNFPTKTEMILPKDKECIENKMAAERQRFDPQSPYYGLDHDKYEDSITRECLSHRADVPQQVYRILNINNPFDIVMGQMTVYRLRLTFRCSNLTEADQSCSRVLPFEQQQWAAYMGTHGDSHWLPRKPL